MDGSRPSISYNIPWVQEMKRREAGREGAQGNVLAFVDALFGEETKRLHKVRSSFGRTRRTLGAAART